MGAFSLTGLFTDQTFASTRGVTAMDDHMTRSPGQMADTARRSFNEGNSGETAEKMRDQAQRTAGDMVDQARTMARDFGEQARNVATSAAQALPPRAREQAMAAGDMIYRQSAWAGDNLVRTVNENPMTAVLIA